MNHQFVRLQDKPKFQHQDSSLSGHFQFRGLRATKHPQMKVVIKVFSRWFITVFIIASVYAVLFRYSTKLVMDTTTKRQFNAFITGLSVALGIAVANSLSAIVGDMRWWILSRRYRSRRKVELILQADGIMSAIMLATRSRRTSIHAAAFAWVLLVLGSQVGLAMIGLCYSVETADKHPIFVNGNVSIPNMSSIQTMKVSLSNYTSLDAQQYAANNYGPISVYAYDTGTLEETPSSGEIWVPTDPLTYCGDEYCQYIFHETATISIEDARMNPTTVTTDRKIFASAVCNSWAVSKGGDGIGTSITVAMNNGEVDVAIPVAGGVNQTTYMTNVLEDCGVGCSIVTAFEASDTSPWYYSCNVTVSSVSGATRPEHQVGDSLRSMASAGIALQGYDVSSLAKDTDAQFKSYPAESIFGLSMDGITENMSRLLSRFAIGVVAMAAEINGAKIVDGAAPMTGVVLQVEHWNYVHMILFLTAFLQLLFGLVAAFLANKVVIPPHGPFSEAQVLRLMASQLDLKQGHDSGSDTDSIRKPRNTSLWIYRYQRVSQDGDYDLYMEEKTHVKEDNESVISDI